ncbi:hypothetical protein [Pelagibacterium sediminicola]|uniref:hypothetical protein n=1 Tax=Pelagibacterium sediminicola TaxID=2248761 RepID=UPI0018E536B8|nr:hypothetical protein [Pelagibacterium sediminicola]
MTHKDKDRRSQSDKFKELARELEADESAEHFDRKLKKIVKSPPPKDGDKPKKDKPGQ